MELFVLGTSQSVAPAPVRERMHVELDEVYSALDDLLGQDGGLLEALPLSTCRRLEIYGVSEEPERALSLLRALLARKSGAAPEEVMAHSYVHLGADAVRHLFRVAAGLDSVVHGEAQILGQVRNALEHPSTTRTVGARLQRLFQSALRTGKRVRTETEIGRGAASLASAALTLLQRQVDSLESMSALVLGAGETGCLIGRLLKKAGVRRLVVANRTEGRARELAVQLGGEFASLDALPSLLAGADLVVGAAAAPERLVRPDMLNGAMKPGSSGPRYFLDLAHPGNFDPALAEVPGVELFDLEHVFERVEAARATRASQVPQAEAIVAEDVVSFVGWLRSRETVSVLRAIREQFLDVARDEAERQAPGPSSMGRDEMTRFARSLARTLLHAPTVALRDADPSTPEGRLLLESAAVLFGVDAPNTEEPR